MPSPRGRRFSASSCFGKPGGRTWRLFIHMAKIEPPAEPEDTPFRVLVPAFVISELKTAFIMGFCIYLPFLLVDLVVSAC